MRLVADTLPGEDGEPVVTWAFEATHEPRVEIAGVGIHPFGRFDGVTNTDMGVHAVRAALAEAGNPTFDAAFCGTAYGGVASGHKVLGALARTGMPIVDVEAGCASGGAALQLAAGAIRAGQYDCVLVFGVEKMPKGIIRSSFFEPWREEAGLAATPAYFALRAQRLLREAGLTKEHLADVVVKNRAQRRAQPERDVPQGGHRRRRARVARSCASRCTSGCCARPTKGAAAIVLRRDDDAERAARSRSRRRGCGRTCPGSVLGEATPLSGIDDTDITPPSTLAARRRVRGSGRRARRRRRRRVPGHRRGARAARVPGARALRAGRAGEAARRPARPSSAAPARSTRAAACCRRANRSARRRSVRSSSSCTSSAAKPGPAKSRARGSASRIPSGAARTRAASSSPAEPAKTRGTTWDRI